MEFEYLYYKILRLARCISDEDFKRLTRKYSREYKIISRSNFFDKDWYSKTYLNNQDIKISPYEHYLFHGLKAGNTPSENFNPNKIFAEPYSYNLYEYEGKNAKKAYKIQHKNENKIKNFRIKESKRKILLISHELSLTGAPRALVNLAKVLQEKGLEPVILSPSFGEMEKEIKAIGIEYYVEPLFITKLLFQNDGLKNFLNSFECILFNTIISMRYLPYIQSENRKVAWIHESKRSIERESRSYDLAKEMPYLDDVYIVSEYAKKFVEPYLSGKTTHILPFWLKEVKKNVLPKRQVESFCISIVGNCSEIKGHDIFIDAIKKLSKDMLNNCRFKVIGMVDKSSFSKKIKQVAPKELIFTGELSYADTLAEINLSDLIVCPSRDESMSMVCIEGMMLEKPILCSSTTGISTFIEHGKNGYIFDVENDDLANILEDLYNKPKELSKVGQEGREIYSSHFTKEKFSQAIEKIFDFEISKEHA